LTPKNIESILCELGISKKFALYVGGADSRKNLPALLEAWAKMPIQLKNTFQLVFAGKIGLTEQLELIAIGKKLGLENCDFYFTGFIQDQQLLALYKSCNLFIYPSKIEGFGLPILEAMSAGAIVVASHQDTIAELIELREALFDPLNISDMTLKIIYGLTDESFRERFKSYSLNKIKQYSWDSVAKKAIFGWENLNLKLIPHDLDENLKKPRLALVTPLPPEKTGVADYSRDLISVLREYYVVTLITPQTNIDLTSCMDCPVRNIQWLYDHIDQIDRVLYQIGNSPFHLHMIDLIKSIPGTVILNDFFLGDLLSWAELQRIKEFCWTEALYLSHGYSVVRERYTNPAGVKKNYPANLEILRHAKGVIVHSEFTLNLFKEFYFENVTENCIVLPLMRLPVDYINKNEAKRLLGFREEDVVVCSFGFLDKTKLNDVLLDCWLESEFSKMINYHLIFVGENQGGSYGEELIKKINESHSSKRIKITGYVSPDQYKMYLSASDLGVQLREISRGETSAAILDCMNYGLPVIVNANGSIQELNHNSVWMLQNQFSRLDLIDALKCLLNDTNKRQKMGELARAILSTKHSPQKLSLRIHNFIEKNYKNKQRPILELMRIIAKNDYLFEPIELRAIAKVIDLTFPVSKSDKTLFLDITATYKTLLKTGIERVAQSLILELISAPPQGYRIEPVYLENINGNWHHKYAKKFTLELMGCPTQALEDGHAEPINGDILLTLDLSCGMMIQAQQHGLIKEYQNRGVLVIAAVYDLLPIQMPEYFPPGADQQHKKWVEVISQFDGAVCISKKVANDLRSWLTNNVPHKKGQKTFLIDWFDLGFDFKIPSENLNKNNKLHLDINEKNHTRFLMVGTIEPRKGYSEVLSAFEVMWLEGLGIELIIVGREGWVGLPDEQRINIINFIKRVRSHPELGKRLFWLENLEDSDLEDLYSKIDCLIAASYGEGFGLPIIESSYYEKPVIARNIEVFREIAGDDGVYFESYIEGDLVETVKNWLKNNCNKKKLEKKKMMSWSACAKLLGDKLISMSNFHRNFSTNLEKKAILEHLDLIHNARINLVSKMLPSGDVILDLGGANCPLYKMGYMHSFKRLYLIDLPPKDRCNMYKDVVIESDSSGGEVIIQYGDMTNLDSFPDSSVDFVWSGQSIEHITYESAERMCKSIYRVLKNGGAFCLDTPNRLITKIHTQDIGGGFIHPEHCVEYTPVELQKLLKNSGFDIKESYGICEMPITHLTQKFTYSDFKLGKQLTIDVERGYIQYFHCIKK
jgi:glycosyltransferase involved in cell wall biosynthesis/predicted SAM-dependent methyltransferase